MWSEDGRMEVLGRCRVCLSRSRALHRLAGTPLEETYERVTRETLVVAGRPCCVCSVCLAALRRSSRFLEAAHQANQALDRWSQSSATCVLTEQPLYPFVRSPVKTVDYPSDDVGDTKVKREIGTPDITQTTGNNTESYFEVQLENTPHVEKTFAKDIKYENNTNDTSTNVPSHSMYVQEYDSNVNDSSTDYGNTTDYVEAILDEPVACSSKTEKKASRTMNTRKRTKNDDVTNGPAVTDQTPISTETQPVDCNPSASDKAGNVYLCQECDYQTVYKHLLRTHQMKHAGEKPFACNLCDYKCSVKFNLKLHVMTHTGEKPFACIYCDYRCTLKQNLDRHIMCHRGERPYACDKCEYRSTAKVGLKRHLKTHSGEKPFACDKCDYRGLTKQLLHQHTMSHTGEKPFACDKCNYRSSKQYNLKTHSLIHTDEKPFACEHCEFRTSRKGDFKRHAMIHTGEKPFGCELCLYRAISKQELKRHSKRHSWNKFLKCPKCSYRTIDRSELADHVKDVHRKTSPEPSLNTSEWGEGSSGLIQQPNPI